MFFLSLRYAAAFVALALVGLYLLPNHVFFPLVGAASLAAGFAVLGKSIGWGIGLILFGAAAGAFGVWLLKQRSQAEYDEATRTEDEVRRRTGMFWYDNSNEQS